MVATRIITSSTSLYDGSLTPGNLVIGGAGSNQIKDSGLTPFKTFISTADPTSAADISQGYSAGSFGLNTGTGRAFVCRSNALGAAVWVLLGPTTLGNYIASNWIIPDGVDGIATSSSIASATTVTLVPFRLRERVTLSQLGTKVQTAGTSNTQLGIYNSVPSTKLPGTNACHTGDIANNVAGNISGSISAGNVQFEAGLYWYGVTQNDATVIYDGPSGGAPFFGKEVGAASLANLSGGIGTNTTQSIQTSTSAYNTWGDLTGATWAYNSNGSKGALPFLLPASVP